MSQKRIFTLLSIIVLFLSPAARAENNHGFPSSLSGEVIMRSLDPQNVFVAVDTSNEGQDADGIVDYTFFYSSKSLPTDPISLRLSFANVEYRTGLLRVSSPNQGRILFFRVAGQRDRMPVSPQDRQEAADKTSRVLWQVFDDQGLGLSGYRGGPNLSMASLGPEEPLANSFGASQVPTISYNDPGGSGTQGGCQSGGRGSNTCSRGCNGNTCDVTCSVSGYFACCNCSGGTVTCNCLPY
jgi:hypothetical protein